MTFKAIVERIEAALRTKTGFSLIRLGDGEGPIMGWPDYQSPDGIGRATNTWFGRSDFTSSELTTIANDLRQAIRSADVLGLPTRFQISRATGYGMVLKAIDHYALYSSSQDLTDSVVHWYLQWSGALARLLNGLDTVHVIGCRDIGPQIAAAFSVKSVKIYLVRGENRFPGPESRPHWPDRFTDVMRELKEIRPGSLFLVGAGVLGKIYCDRIKAGGGVALDVGSLLDSWAHIPSRERYQADARAFTLEHFKRDHNDWSKMMAALAQCAAEHHARDTTLTY